MHVPKCANIQEWKGSDVKIAVTIFTKEDEKDQLWKKKHGSVSEDQQCQRKTYYSNNLGRLNLLDSRNMLFSYLKVLNVSMSWLHFCLLFW